MQVKDSSTPRNRRPGFLRSFAAAYTFINQSGLKKHNELNRETIRLVGLVNVFGTVGFLYLSTMSLVNLFAGNYLHTLILSVFALVILVFLLLQRFLGTYQLTTKSFMAMLILLCIYLTMTGGVENNGHLWTFMFPPLFMYMYGLKKGTIGNLIALFTIAFILYFKNGILLQTEYLPSFGGRYLAAYLGVTIVAIAAEFSRDKATVELLKVNDHLVDMSRELERAARKDSLTGLSNRRDLYRQMDYERKRMERNHTSYSVLLADVDHFKKVNDNYGHDCGDEALKAVADIISSSIRKLDIACRWGGEEFLIVLPDTPKDGGLVAAEKIRKEIESHPFNYKDFTFNLTISIGLESCSYENEFEYYIVEADRKLYQAKKDGRNRVIS